MRLADVEMAARPDHKSSALLRVSSLPLVQSALESVSSAYSGVKDRYPLLGLMGGVAEVGVRSVSEEAMRRVQPLLQSLEPQLEVANSFAIDGLETLERNFPILNQSTDEVLTHLKDALFLTVDDVQLWVVDGVDGALDGLQRLAGGLRLTAQQLQETPAGQAAAAGVDNALSRLEDAAAYYLPLPPTLRREWEMRVQELEDEDDGEEPGLWTRVRSLLLTLSLQLHHRMSRARTQLQGALQSLGEGADKVGLGRVLGLSGELLRFLRGLVVALFLRAENGRAAALRLPLQALRDLQELSGILLQLAVNSTPLYDLVQKPSPQQVEDFLSQEDVGGGAGVSSRRGSANSLFLRAMDGRPRRRRSLYSLAKPCADPPNGRRPSLRAPEGGGGGRGGRGGRGGAGGRRPSAADLLLAPLKQFVSQSQKALEFLSPNSNEAAAAAIDTDAVATETADC
ncbi:LOW QUALITY PROTEIN: perilipin 6 [Menidia menidia]